MSNIDLSSKRFSTRGILLGIIPSLVIDGALPFLVYTLLRPHTTDLLALTASALPPLISNIISIIRTRKLDAFGTLILLGIIVSIGAIFLGGDPKILLIRESIFTVALGIACFISLLLPRPLMFYISRHFATEGNPEKLAGFDSLWQYKIFRSMSYLITIVWGAAWIGEFILRIILVYTLSIPQFLIVSPIVFNAITIGLILWTTTYSIRVGHRGREMRERAEKERVDEQVQRAELNSNLS